MGLFAYTSDIPKISERAMARGPKRLPLAGAVAVALMTGTPAPAAYWWQPDATQAEAVEKHCKNEVGRLMRRTRDLLDRLDVSPATQARFAYALIHAGWTPRAAYRACADILLPPIPTQSAK